jgi:hypothetical protein
MQILGKKLGKTLLGCSYGIIHDTPTVFHITVQKEHRGICETVENPKSMEELDNKVLSLEQELLSQPLLTTGNSNTE